MAATSATVVGRRAASLRRGRQIKAAVVYATVLFYLFVVLLPLYWMFRSSISENANMYGVGIDRQALEVAA